MTEFAPRICYEGDLIDNPDEQEEMYKLFGTVIEYLKEIIIRDSEIPHPLDRLEQLYPASIELYSRNNNNLVSLLMNNYKRGPTSEYGDRIMIRRTEGGLLIGNIEAPIGDFRQAIKRQLEEIIR